MYTFSLVSVCSLKIHSSAWAKRFYVACEMVVIQLSGNAFWCKFNIKIGVNVLCTAYFSVVLCSSVQRPQSLGVEAGFGCTQGFAAAMEQWANIELSWNHWFALQFLTTTKFLHIYNSPQEEYNLCNLFMFMCLPKLVHCMCV